jgi:hypothetical protein
MWEEGEGMFVKYPSLNGCGQFSTSVMEKEIALCTAVKRGRNYILYTGLTTLDIHGLFVAKN